MSNNLNYKLPDSGGAPVSTQETVVDSVLQHIQRVKVGVGAKGSYQGDLTFGNTTMDNSLPVTIASDQDVKVNHTKSLMVEVLGSGASLNSYPIPSTSISNYRWVSVQLTGSTNEITFEVSNDNTNWYPLALLSTISTWQVASTTANGIYYGPISFKYFRARISAYTAGTTSAIAEFSAAPSTLHATHVRTELGYPIDITDTIPGAINAGQVASIPYAYNPDSGVFQRQIAGSSTPPTYTTNVYPIVRIAGPVSNTNLLAGRSTYIGTTSTAITVDNTSAAVTSVAYLWHPSSNTKRVSLQKILVNICTSGSSVGDFMLSVARITGENASPSGVTNTIVSKDSAQTSSTLSFKSGTAAPTRQTGDAISMVFPADLSGNIELTEILGGKGFICRSGVAEGWEVRCIAGAGLTPAPKFTTTFVWTEE